MNFRTKIFVKTVAMLLVVLTFFYTVPSTVFSEITDTVSDIPSSSSTAAPQLPEAPNIFDLTKETGDGECLRLV